MVEREKRNQSVRTGKVERENERNSIQFNSEWLYLKVTQTFIMVIETQIIPNKITHHTIVFIWS